MHEVTWIAAPSEEVTAFSWVDKHGSDSLSPHQAGRLVVQTSEGKPSHAYEPVTYEWYSILASIVDGEAPTFSLYWQLTTVEDIEPVVKERLRQLCDDAVLGKDSYATAARVLAAFAHEHDRVAIGDREIRGAIAFAVQYHRSSPTNVLDSTILDGESVDDILDAINIDEHQQLYRTIGSHNSEANVDSVPKRQTLS